MRRATRLLYGALNRTVTPMGARRLRDWLSQPLADVERDSRRQEAVQTLDRELRALENFRAQLAEVRDLERTIGRLSLGTGNARDLARAASWRWNKSRRSSEFWTQWQRDRFLAMPEFSRTSLRQKSEATRDVAERSGQLASQLPNLPDLVELIGRAIVDEPPLAVKEGGLIRDGFDAALDELRDAPRGRQGLDRETAAGGDRAHRHHVAESAVQFRLRLLHRSHASRTSTKFRRITSASKPSPTANASSRPS